MLRRLAIATAATGAVIAAGVWLHGALLTEPSAPATPDDSHQPIAQPLRIPADHARTADARTADASTPRVGVTAVTGAVERLSAGEWTPVSPGDELAPDDVIRTGADGTVTLDVGASEVVMDPDTRLAVVSLTAAVSRVRLGQGRVAAKVPRTGSSLDVSIEGSDGVAEADEGEFAVLSDGDGSAAVAVTSGRVRLSARGTTVEVGEGEQARVRPGKPPTAPAAMPTSLFLKVRDSRGVRRTPRYAVRGSATPGAVISVNGSRVQVRDDGTFVHVVMLREGNNDIRVDGVDAAGRRRSASSRVTVDTEGPKVEGQVEWGPRE